jgi:hypothetical protein
VLEACLAEGSGLRPDVPEEKREEPFFLIPQVGTLFLPEERHEFRGRCEPSRSIAVRGSMAQPHCLHESIVMVARERNQGGVALHPTTLITTRRTATRLSPPRSTPRRATTRSRRHDLLMVVGQRRLIEQLVGEDRGQPERARMNVQLNRYRWSATSVSASTGPPPETHNRRVGADHSFADNRTPRPAGLRLHPV